MDLDQWILTITMRRWPVLPRTAKELKEACERHSDLVNLVDLANICLSDPLLLFDVLRVVGRSRLLQQNESVTTVEQALILMGLKLANQRFRQITHFDEEDNALPFFMMEALGECLGRSRFAAFLVKEWWSEIGEYKVEEGFLLAMIYNLPACLYMIQKREVLLPSPIVAMEKAFSKPYEAIVQAFILKIPLPRVLSYLLNAQDQTVRATLFRLAVCVANTHPLNQIEYQEDNMIPLAANAMNIDEANAHRGVWRAALTVARHPRSVGYTFPIRERMMLPPPAQDTKQAAIRKCLNQALVTLLPVWKAELGVERLAYYTHESKLCLKLIALLGEEEKVAPLFPKIALGSQMFLTQILGKFQAALGSVASSEKWREHYSDSFLSERAQQDFMIISVFADDISYGLLYADNVPSNRPIKATDYQALKSKVAQFLHLHHQAKNASQ